MRDLLGPEGCPWDREQDERKLRRYVLEEACEVIDAIEGGDPAELCEELGDLALQIAFLAELARAKGQFGPDDVIRAIAEKLIRRHPHVFADVTVQGAEDVVRNWAAIKSQEKGRERRLLDGIPRSLPALARAQQMGERVHRVGFDWSDAPASYLKVQEELAELAEAQQSANPQAVHHEFGDLLLALVNYSRHLGVDAEAALRHAGDRFERRFADVEDQVKTDHGGWPAPDSPKLPLAVLDAYWERAKTRLP